MPFPIALAVISALMGGAQAAGSIYGARSAKNSAKETTEAANKHDLEVENIRDKRERDLAMLVAKLEESGRDPFRNTGSQMDLAEKLDRLSSYQAPTFDFSASPYASYIPKVSGGRSAWAPSDELRTAARTGRSATLRGTNQAGSVTGLDINGILNLLAGDTTRRAPVSNTMPIDGTGPGAIAPVTPPEGPLGPDVLQGGASDLSGGPDLENNPFNATSLDQLLNPAPTRRPRPRRRTRYQPHRFDPLAA